MLKAGDRAPDIHLPDTEGKNVELADAASVGPILLAFFKVSCPVCQFTFPFLDRIAGAGRLPVIGISQDTAEDTKEFSAEFGVDFPMLLDSYSSGYAASNAYGITHVPSLFLVESGTVAAAVSGFSREDLEDIGRRYGVRVFQDGEQTPAFKPG
jgi:peroxiredoxin